MNGTRNWCTLVDVHPESQTTVGRRAHPRLPTSSRWLSNSTAPVPLAELADTTWRPARCGQPHVAPRAFKLCPAADGGVGGVGLKAGASRAGEYLSLARTLQPRLGLQASCGLALDWIVRDALGTGSLRYLGRCDGPSGLGLSVFPIGLRSLSKTFTMLRAIL